MKMIHISKSVIVLLACASVFTACNKDAASVTTVNNQAVSSNVSDVAGATKLVLRPGPKDGHDAYVYYWAGDLNSINGNFNSVPELPVERWTQDGYDEAKRFYIKFCELSTIPRSATVVKATLEFFGLDGFSLTHPQGNSIYTGSPYNIYPDNSCLVQRVIEPWDEHTITWATQPNVTDVDESVIPTSTDQWNYNPKIDVTDLVQKMVSNPGKNYGLKVSLSIDKLYRSQVYASCEATDASRRPRLIVWYK